MITSLNAVKAVTNRPFGGNNTLSDIYDKYMFFMPHIVCIDGFTISIQVNHNNYCGSENGFRQFGYEWKVVEWGYPSEEIDPVKYGAEYSESTLNTVCSCETALMDELLEEHGGIDFAATVALYIEYTKENEKEKKYMY